MMTSTDTTEAQYCLLGASGLRVSRLALGAMTFGRDLGWGSDEDEARRIFDCYFDHGGNFVDTANIYTNGTSEEMLGRFSLGKRDRMVIATKYANCIAPGDPNAGGAHRKSMVRSVEQSLRRLQTDYIDVLYLHCWDYRTPGDEVLRAFDDLVRAGKVLYAGLSNVPAWQASRLQTIAELRGLGPIAALQVEYSLIERTPERDLLPMARAMGMGVVPWSPLAGGVLSGKYTRADLGLPPPQLTVVDISRKELNLARGAVSERSISIAEVVGHVAQEIGCRPSQVALAWVLSQPGVIAPIVGARTTEQLSENLAATSITLSPEQLAKLDGASAISLGYPHDFLALDYLQMQITGGTRILGRSS